MARFLFDEPPLIINYTLAKIIGPREAAFVQKVQYWVNENRKRGRNYRDGKYWTYNSIQAWHEHCFACYSVDTVKRTFAKLRKMGLLIVGNYNKDPRDRTNWYTVNEEKLDALYDEYERQCAIKDAEALKKAEEEEASNPSGQFTKMEDDFAYYDAEYTSALGQSAPMEEDFAHPDEQCTSALGQSAPMEEGSLHQSHWGNLHQPLPHKYHTSTTQVQQTLCSRVQDAHCEPDVNDNHSDQPTALSSSPSALNHPDPEQVDGIGASKNKSVEKGEEHEHETEVAARKQEAQENFERLWQLYPLKRGKGRVSDTKKQALLKYGYDQLVRAINRYTREVAEAPFEKCYQNGSTFFNSGFIDYLDENYEACVPKPKRGLSERTGKTLSNVYFEDHTPEDYDILEE
ncbi:hypothetical protein ACKQTC_08275 [Peptococcus simiae]|uniref:Uncharacterized protein n=1 Tax=Peptococcus simiae TaxID=1643805 RepID=A0ABW9H2M9_9FIRM